MELRAARLLARYKELQVLAFESLLGRTYSEGDMQDRIRTFAILRDIDEQQEEEKRIKLENDLGKRP